ncbi:conserved hypothetical protein [Isorropodon fossajaponicum endosymbiont JTNG4]|uniref:hypothetical protein n=1 Tax=Isorropodon fossajaponicum symbiont TaxID=883811 RepID=UPI0019158CCA|nr:hypothetical protein [Isorropodon fossajaponicum symbiont]BBB23499.1 conserved hypothetical protein [Isorropodon fossajaponicum endosymbiont JTNG4]
MKLPIVLVVYLIFFSNTYANMNSDSIVSIHTGSYLKYIVPSGDDFTEKFANDFFDIEIRVNDDSVAFQKIIIGTFKNSENNRCILLGVQKNWKHLGKRLIFEGVYAYAGEFFFGDFSHCGDDGVYAKIKKQQDQALCHIVIMA